METAVPADAPASAQRTAADLAAGFTLHPPLARTLARRRDALGRQAPIDWGHAETLAFASVLTEGTPVRLTGQDAERGTFSHRHAVLHDVNTGARYIPSQHLDGRRAIRDLQQPALRDRGDGLRVRLQLGGPEALVLWEAQYGDFANVAQPIIDQFISADRTKWGQDSGRRAAAAARI